MTILPLGPWKIFDLFSPGAKLDFQEHLILSLGQTEFDNNIFSMVKIIYGRTNLQILDLDGFLKIRCN